MYGFTALFPSTFVSNVFVPIETMPGWLQAFVKANPVTPARRRGARAAWSAGRSPSR